ncbi:MAG: hypothetical protein ACRDHB_00330 [Actinomycetota bacterium]
MTNPIVFVSHFRIKEGRFESFRQHFGEPARALELEKPQTSAFLAYVDDHEGELSIVHVFSDADAMDTRTRGGRAFGGCSPVHGPRWLGDLRKAECKRHADAATDRHKVGGYSEGSADILRGVLPFAISVRG